MGFLSKLFFNKEKKYDEQRRLVKIIQYYSTGALAKVLDFNPETDNKIKYTEYKDCCSLDKESYKVRETIYYSNGNINFVIEFKNEIPIKQIIYNKNGSIKEVKNF
ncbi:DUF2963 domain-containing protein [Candidatus Phytoplasma solani]|uniref:DUF2963 domain-containing protein n=1 Tax=Candidatus Phytoplasma solani TaxID=69896 RepID=UPI00358EE433